MPGTVTEIGSVSLGSVLPMLGLAGANVSFSASAALGDIEAKIAGLLNVQAALILPQLPTLAIAGALDAVASLQATVTIPVPSLQVKAIASLLLELQASLLNLQAQLTFAISLGNLLSAPGVAAYTYDGTADSLGSSLQAVTGGGISGGAAGDQCNAVILATSIPATWAAIAKIFGL